MSGGRDRPGFEQVKQCPVHPAGANLPSDWQSDQLSHLGGGPPRPKGLKQADHEVAGLWTLPSLGLCGGTQNW